MKKSTNTFLVGKEKEKKRDSRLSRTALGARRKEATPKFLGTGVLEKSKTDAVSARYSLRTLFLFVALPLRRFPPSRSCSVVVTISRRTFLSHPTRSAKVGNPFLPSSRSPQLDGDRKKKKPRRTLPVTRFSVLESFVEAIRHFRTILANFVTRNLTPVKLALGVPLSRTGDRRSGQSFEAKSTRPSPRRTLLASCRKKGRKLSLFRRFLLSRQQNRKSPLSLSPVY